MPPQVVKGELTDKDALSGAVAQSAVVVSLLGPNTIRGINPEIYFDFYKELFQQMRAHAVRRIFAMSTLSYSVPEDRSSLKRGLLVALVRTVVPLGYQTVHRLCQAFLEHAEGLDWTIFRIAGIPGGSDEASWRQDREDGEAFEGWVGEEGWCTSQRRGALARWLVDAVEDGKPQWIGKMPAVSRLAGSARRA
jgi:nucleoside-diphosphate-sugar epimerase